MTSLSEFMVLSMDGMKVLQIDLASSKEHLTREQGLNHLLLAKLTQEEEKVFKLKEQIFELESK